MTPEKIDRLIDYLYSKYGVSVDFNDILDILDSD